MQTQKTPITRSNQHAYRAGKAPTDFQQEVTDRIIVLIEEGGLSWVKTWTTTGGLPLNVMTGKPYQGMNIVLLKMSAHCNSNLWLTYKQAQSMGGNVRKGEHGERCFYYKMVEKNTTNDQGEKESYPMLKQFVVFNSTQIEGIEFPHTAERIVNTTFEKHASAEMLVSRTGAKIEYRESDTAVYREHTDTVYMPLREQFANEEEFYSTVFHELAHWTGATHRLDRANNSRFGAHDYAFEELVAELTSAFIMTHLGLEKHVIKNHAAYVNSWLKKLRSDKTAIFRAASAASKAFAMIVKLDSCEGESDTPQ